jgi:hypothetical protein
MVTGELREVLAMRVLDPRAINPGFGRWSFACGSKGVPHSCRSGAVRGWQAPVAG